MVTKVIGLLLTPPGIILLLALIGFLVQIRWRTTGNIIIGSSLRGFVRAQPVHDRARAVAPLEAKLNPLSPATLTPGKARKQADAIVVLGAGRYPSAGIRHGRHRQQCRIGTPALRRPAAPAHGALGLVTGGAPFGTNLQALLMQGSFEEDFQIRPKWAETQSGNTHENAINSRQILATAGIRRIYRHARRHMPRAQWAFVNLRLRRVAGAGIGLHHARQGRPRWPGLPSVPRTVLRSNHLALRGVWASPVVQIQTRNPAGGAARKKPASAF